MRALVLAELSRLVARRLPKVLLGLVILGSAAAGIITFVLTDPTSPADIERQRASGQARFQACLADPPDIEIFGPDGRPVLPGTSESEFVEELCRREAFTVVDDRFPTQDLPEVLMGTTAPLTILALVMGAASIGGDWPTRSVTTLLTFEPRRVRVLAAKAVAVALGAIGLYLLGQALILAGLAPAIVLNGTGDTAGSWSTDMAGVLARSSVLVAVLAVVGFAGASVARTTTVVLGAAFGYVVVVENVVRAYLSDWTEWLLLGNAAALVSGADKAVDVMGGSALGAGAYLVALAVTLMVVAGFVFARRDIA